MWLNIRDEVSSQSRVLSAEWHQVSLMSDFGVIGCANTVEQCLSVKTITITIVNVLFLTKKLVVALKGLSWCS